MKALKVREFYEDSKESLGAEVVVGMEGMERCIYTSDINRPGLALAGYTDYFAYDRVQVMGNTETHYMEGLEKPVLQERLHNLFSYQVPCFVVSRGLTPRQEFLDEAQERAVPILRSPLATSKVISKTILYLDDKFSPEATVHGLLMDVYGVGVLLLGKAGVGKSECALELIERGHRLVADDVVNIKRRAERFLYGEAFELIQHHMEIRGLGIIDIKSLFGAGAVRPSKRISLVIQLEEWDSTKDYDLVGIREETYTLLEVTLPKVVVPVRPGRNITLIIEVAAMNSRLKDLGLHSAKNLEEQVMKALLRKPQEEDLE